jgi:curved DNA-binding protein
MSNYYETLGVSRTATDDEIKRAYRSAAMKHHPDRGGDAGKFQEIQAAYATLSDPNKRSQYDNPAPQGGFHFHGPEGFEQFFGQGSPFGDIFGFHQRRPQGNRNIQLQTAISLEEAFYGKEMLASVTLPSGHEQTVNITIPKGIHEGTTLKLQGMGDDSQIGAPRGDMLLSVQIQNHPVFKRQGDDLIQEHVIDCFDALLGGTITVKGIDGKQLETNIPAGVQHDAILSLNGHGMPNFNNHTRRGRLLIRIKIKIPTLSEEQKSNLRQLNIK